MTEDEKLMAYADGELSPEESRVLEARMSADPALRARLQVYLVTRDAPAAAFAQIAREPVPHRLIATITRTPIARRPSATERIRHKLSEWLAAVTPDAGFSLPLAASVGGLVLLGAAGGWLAAGKNAPASGMFRVADGSVVAAGTLAAALDTAPGRSLAEAAAAEPGEAVPVLSFRSDEKGVCRQYRVRGVDTEPDLAGLACRAPGDTWRIVLNVETPAVPKPAPGAPYGSATGDSIPAVESTVDAIITGPAFGPDEEAAHIAKGWR